MPHGLYLVTTLKLPGVIHYGILDAGNRLRRVDASLAAVVVHQGPDGLKEEPFKAQEWSIGPRIIDEYGAQARPTNARTNARYDLFGHNCEHFVRYLATGTPKSLQVGVGIGVVIAIALWWFFGRDS